VSAKETCTIQVGIGCDRWRLGRGHWSDGCRSRLSDLCGYPRGMSSRRLCLRRFRRFSSLVSRGLLHHDHLLDQDLVTRVDPVGIFDMAIELPDLRREEWVLQILFADFPEGVSSLNSVNFVSLGCRGFSVCRPVVRRLLLGKRPRSMALSRD